MIGWVWNGELTSTVAFTEVIIVLLALFGIWQHRLARDDSLQDLGAAQAVARNRPNILLQIRVARSHIRSETFRLWAKCLFLVYGGWTMILPNRPLFNIFESGFVPQLCVILILIDLNIETWMARQDRREMLLDAMRAEHITATATALAEIREREAHAETNPSSG